VDGARLLPKTESTIPGAAPTTKDAPFVTPAMDKFCDAPMSRATGTSMNCGIVLSD
jgi:hypothetical protein